MIDYSEEIVNGIIRFYSTFLFIGLFVAFSYYSSNYKPKNHNKLLTGLLIIGTILIMALSAGTDKPHYEHTFKYLLSSDLSDYRDIGWLYLMYFIHTITAGSVTLFFICIAALYVINTYIFCKRISYQDSMMLLVAAIITYGFYNYGTNIIRSGLAISLVLLSFYQFSQKKYWQIAVLTILAVLFHKSMVIPIFAYACALIFKNAKYNIFIWVACLAVGYVFGEIISYFAAEIFLTADERVEQYLLTDDRGYQVGFRLDFIAYSVIPIVFGFYYTIKKKYEDKLYNTLFNTYLIANAGWLLMIRMPYSDRFAYLSWFLFPFLLLLPLVQENYDGCNNKLIGKVLAFLVLINFVLNLMTRII